MLARESHFHDNWAHHTDTLSIKVREAFEAPTALENQFILKKLGPIQGKSVLDVGAGLCESSVYFAMQGAQVTATDLSPGMLQKGEELAAAHQVRIETVLSAAEDLAETGRQFDIIYAANLLHHLEDKEKFLKSIQRLLKPGGQFCSWDPIRYNPLIYVYRRLATRVRTPDENPLGIQDLKLIQSHLPGAQPKFFWISTLTLFLKYFLVDRIHPNANRYWKKIYTESPDSLWWWKPLKALDGVLSSIPFVGWLAWNMVITASAPEVVPAQACPDINNTASTTPDSLTASHE